MGKVSIHFCQKTILAAFLDQFDISKSTYKSGQAKISVQGYIVDPGHNPNKFWFPPIS